jgi:hypothetical protein
MIKLIDILKEAIEDPEKGIDDVLKQHPEILQKGTKEEYIQHLNSIFSSSKIKNIAYHDSDTENIEYFSKTDNGIWSTGDENWWQRGKYKYSLLINTTNPFITKDAINSSYSKEFFLNPANKKYDALITTGTSNDIKKGVYVVMNPEQIYILGSKKDIESFKK